MQSNPTNNDKKHEKQSFFANSLKAQVPPPMKSPHLQKKDGEKSKDLDDSSERKDMAKFPPELYNQVQRQLKQ